AVGGGVHAGGGGVQAGGGGLEAGGGRVHAVGGGVHAGGGVLEAGGGVVNKDELEIYVEGEDGEFTRYQVFETWEHTLIDEGHEIPMSPINEMEDPEDLYFLLVRGAY
ncbi:hypothetical protein BVRB_017350, partial [Beta vulgaris subsp. vulgaris]